MIKVTYKEKTIELQVDKGRVIIHYGQIHLAALTLESALAKLDKATD